MDASTACEAIDFVFRQSLSPPITITFFGGEPLLKFDLIKGLVPYIRRKASNLNLSVNFSMTTNGTLLTDEIIWYCGLQGINLVLSIDGNRVSHDANRVTPSGHGSFDAIISRLPKILKVLPYTVAYGVITPLTVKNLYESVQFLFGQGFRYVFFTPDFASTWTRRDLHTLSKQYNMIAEDYIRRLKEGQRVSFMTFDQKIRAHVFKGPFCCGAGIKTISIAPSGRIYPCVQFVRDDVGSEQVHSLGDIRRGFDPARRAGFITASTRVPNGCEGCAYLGRCTNRCACINYQTTGDPFTPSYVVCQHERLLIPIADRIGATLWRQRNLLFIYRMYYDRLYAFLSFIQDYRRN
jgi:uncharacterized protein